MTLSKGENVKYRRFGGIWTSRGGAEGTLPPCLDIVLLVCIYELITNAVKLGAHSIPPDPKQSGKAGETICRTKDEFKEFSKVCLNVSRL